MAVNLYYKVITGFDEGRSITIGADELEKAYGVFIQGGRAIFREGAVDGKYIQQISPDWNRIMGWSQEYELCADDYNELSDKGIDRSARNFQSKIQERVQYLIETKQPNLIGTNAKLPELDRPATEKREGKMSSMSEIVKHRE